MYVCTSNLSAPASMPTYVITRITHAVKVVACHTSYNVDPYNSRYNTVVSVFTVIYLLLAADVRAGGEYVCVTCVQSATPCNASNCIFGAQPAAILSATSYAPHLMLHQGPTRCRQAPLPHCEVTRCFSQHAQIFLDLLLPAASGGFHPPPPSSPTPTLQYLSKYCHHHPLPPPKVGCLLEPVLGPAPYSHGGAFRRTHVESSRACAIEPTGQASLAVLLCVCHVRVCLRVC